MPEYDRSANVYVVDGARTPFLRAAGKPGNFQASDLALCAARPLLNRLSLDPSFIDEVIVGCVMPSCEEANIGRLIALRLGLSLQTPAWTVQRNCASGLQAIDTAADSIRSGRSSIVLAGGTEAMSQAPLLYSRQMVEWFAAFTSAKHWQKKLKTVAQFRPPYLKPVIALMKGLTDASIGMNMGQTAEELAFRFEINRAQMDAYAARSHVRALAAQFSDEVVPAYSWQGDVFQTDNGVREDSTVDRLGKLRSVFDKYGNVTAGNSSQITDGAAFMVLASEQAVKEHQLPVLGRIVDSQWAGLDPRVMGLGPVHAMVPLMNRHGLKFDDLACVEINEAFASQVMACQKAISSDAYCQQHFGCDGLGELNDEKLNPNGGAIAIGHPVGASGARLVLHILNQLRHSESRVGMASLCIGGGQGGAMLIERV